LIYALKMIFRNKQNTIIKNDLIFIYIKNRKSLQEIVGFFFTK